MQRVMSLPEGWVAQGGGQEGEDGVADPVATTRLRLHYESFLTHSNSEQRPLVRWM
jgi:hypothetical protein